MLQTMGDGRHAAVGRASAWQRAALVGLAGASLTLLKLDKEIETLLAAPAEIAVRVF